MQVAFDPAQLRRRRVHRVQRDSVARPPAPPPSWSAPAATEAWRGLQQPRPGDDAGRQHAAGIPDQETCGAHRPSSTSFVYQVHVTATRNAGSSPSTTLTGTLTRVQSTPPGRRVAKDPPAAPERPHQPVGRLGDRTGRRRDRHPRPLERQAALPVGLPPHREQALRREHHPEPGRQQENADQEATNNGNPATAVTARTTPERTSTGCAGQPTPSSRPRPLRHLRSPRHRSRSGTHPTGTGARSALLIVGADGGRTQ